MPILVRRLPPPCANKVRENVFGGFPSMLSKRPIDLKSPFGEDEKETVRVVAISATHLALGSTGGSVLIASLSCVESGFEAQARNGQHHNHSAILALAFSNDGTLLASGGRDGTVLLWRVEDGLRCIARLEEHPAWVRSVKFAPDDKFLATAGDQDCAVCIWKVQPDEGSHSSDDADRPRATSPSAKLEFLSWPTSVAFFSADRLAVGLYEGSVKMYCFTGDTWVLETEHDVQEQAQISPPGWAGGMGSRASSVSNKPLAIRDLVFSPLRSGLAAVAGPGVVMQPTGSRLPDLHSGAVLCTAFSTKGPLLVTGGEDGALWLWSLTKDSGTALVRLKTYSRAVLGVGFCPRSHHFIAVDGLGTITLWR